jgi:hypothetical protein
MLTLLCVKGSKRFTLYRVYMPVVPETRGPTDMGPFYMFDNFRNRQVVFYDGHHGLWMSGDAEFAEVPE